VYREPAILILGRASGTLLESDFYRASPQGLHIEGWATGITKIIPGRNPTTLTRNGSYLLLFTDRFMAQAYKDNLINYHRISRDHAPRSLASPLPPSRPLEISNGLTPTEVIKSFTVIPSSQNDLSIRIPRLPLDRGLAQVVNDGGYKQILQAEASGSAQGKAGVIKLSITPAIEGTLTSYGIRKFIEKDGFHRNLKWNLCKGENAITPLLGGDSSGGDLGVEMNSTMNKRNRFSAWVVAFMDAVEARRFIRTWHRREWPDYDTKGRRSGLKELGVVDEQSATVHAELLW